MKLNFSLVNKWLWNLEYRFKEFFTIIFSYFLGIDKIPLLLRNIEFIRLLQTSIFFLLQVNLTTTWFLTQLKNIESKIIFLDKKLQLKKWIEKRTKKFPTKLKTVSKNFLIFLKHIKKFKIYNLWGWWGLESFLFPSKFIRYFYVSKSSSAFIKRFSIFLKRFCIFKPINLFLKFLISLNYILIINIMKSLVIYKKFWLQQFLLNSITSY